MGYGIIWLNHNLYFGSNDRGGYVLKTWKTNDTFVENATNKRCYGFKFTLPVFVHRTDGVNGVESKCLIVKLIIISFGI